MIKLEDWIEAEIAEKRGVKRSKSFLIASSVLDTTPATIFKWVKDGLHYVEKNGGQVHLFKLSKTVQA